MAQPIRWSLSVDEDTPLVVERWRERLSPMFDKPGARSSLVCFLLKLAESMANDAKVLPILAALQGLRVNNESQEFAGHTSGEENRPAKKPLGRVGREAHSLGRRIACIGLNRRYADQSAKGRASWASFPGRIRPSFANSTALWRAAS